MREIVWTTPSKRDLAGLDRNVAKRIIDKFVHYAETGEGDVRPLQGRPGQWRLRDGDYRVIYEPNPGILVVKHVGDRREAYRK